MLIDIYIKQTRVLRVTGDSPLDTSRIYQDHGSPVSTKEADMYTDVHQCTLKPKEA